VFKYIYEEHNFITGNLHCKLTQRRLYTKVGKKIQNAITATKVFSDFIVKEIEKTVRLGRTHLAVVSPLTEVAQVFQFQEYS
jgi:hypothetical protein